MKGKIISFILLAFISIAPAYGQTTIKGTIVDSQQVGIPYAGVKVLKMDSTFVKGVATDSIGCFNMEISSEGNYILLVSSMGYAPYSQNINVHSEEITIPNITLENNSVALNEVIIKGNKLVRKDDKVIIIPDQQIVKHTFGGYDLLADLMIPNVRVDRFKGTVETFGGNVSLYIDGRKVDYREIKNLKPKDVEKIEYYDVPTGKYAEDIAAINFITRQYTTGGYVALDGTQQFTYFDGDYNVAAKVASGNTTITFFGGYNGKEYSGDQYEKNETFHFKEGDMMRNYKQTGGTNKSNQEYAQMNIVTRKQKYMLSEKITLVRNENPGSTTTGVLTTSYGAAPSESFSRNKQSNLMPKVNLYGNFDITDKQYLEVTLMGSYSKNKYLYEYQLDGFTTNTDSKEDAYTLQSNIKYGIKLPHKNSLSFSLSSYYSNNSISYTGTYTSWQHQWTLQNSSYINYVQRIGKWNISVTPAFTVLQYRLHGTEIVKQYTPRFFSTIFVQPAPNQQLSLDLTYANANPNISATNMAEQTVDELIIKRGNKDLRPSNFFIGTLNYNIQFGKFNAFVMGSYTYQHRPIVSVFYQQEGKMVQSFDDRENTQSLVGLLSLTWRAFKNFNMSFDAQYNHVDFYGVCDKVLDQCNFRIVANYYWKDFAFRLNGGTKSKILLGNMIKEENPVYYNASVSWSHNVWNLEVGTSAPFTKRVHFYSSLDAPLYSYNVCSSSKQYQQTVYLKAAYTFNFGKKTQKDWKNIDMNVNSAILKAK